MILVTGPTGNTGKQVLDGLRARGIPVRAMLRSQARAAELAAQGIDTVLGDFEEPDTLRRALGGVDKAFLVCTPDERLVRCETNFIAAACDAGVRHIVKMGAYGASLDAASPNLRMHAQVEQALVASGLAYTIVRPHGFMQTWFWMSAPLVMQQGILSYPAGDGPIPLIDVRDVGPALIRALTEPGFENRAFNLTGPQAIRPSEMAQILTQALGRPIGYVDSDLDGLNLIMRQMCVPDAPREHVLWAFREQRAGRMNYTSRDHEAFGLRLHSFADFAADLATGLTGTATSNFSR